MAWSRNTYIVQVVKAEASSTHAVPQSNENDHSIAKHLRIFWGYNTRNIKIHRTAIDTGERRSNKAYTVLPRNQQKKKKKREMQEKKKEKRRETEKRESEKNRRHV